MFPLVEKVSHRNWWRVETYWSPFCFYFSFPSFLGVYLFLFRISLKILRLDVCRSFRSCFLQAANKSCLDANRQKIVLCNYQIFEFVRRFFEVDLFMMDWSSTNVALFWTNFGLLSDLDRHFFLCLHSWQSKPFFYVCVEKFLSRLKCLHWIIRDQTSESCSPEHSLTVRLISS